MALCVNFGVCRKRKSQTKLFCGAARASGRRRLKNGICWSGYVFAQVEGTAYCYYWRGVFLFAVVAALPLQTTR